MSRIPTIVTTTGDLRRMQLGPECLEIGTSASQLQHAAAQCQLSQFESSLAGLNSR